ncbi:hypothetical protein ACO2JO_13460 [Leptospira interrogans]|jgi:hypothetical protein
MEAQGFVSKNERLEKPERKKPCLAEFDGSIIIPEFRPIPHRFVTFSPALGVYMGFLNAISARFAFSERASLTVTTTIDRPM